MRSHLFGAGKRLLPLGLPDGSRRLTSGTDFASQQYTGHCIRKLCLPWTLRTFVLALLTVSALLPAAAQVKPVRRVLVFNDFGSVSSPGIAEMDREIFDGLQNSSYMVEFYNENLEVTLFPEEASQRQVREWYIREYSDRRPDVIITVGPASLRFMQEVHEGPFKDTPVVFCGIMEIPAGLEANSRFTGAWSGVQTEKTMESALRLQPGTRHVVVVGGVGSLDRQEEAIVRDNLRGYESKFDFTYLTDLSMPNLLEQLKLLPSDTIVLHTAITQDAAGNRFIDATQAVPMVAGVARAPVFVVDDVDLRNGAVGGDVLSWAATARDAAKSALRILNGEKPQDIPIVRSKNVYMFDWRALQHWGLKESNLPPGSTVLNRQPSLWESFRGYVIGGMTLILVEALLISGLLWQRTRRKAVETKLIIANKQLETDITERKLAEEALAGMSRKLIGAQERERIRIARELHDDFVQRLALLSLDLQGMKEGLPDSAVELRSRVDDAEKRTSEISTDVQALSHELHSSKLEYVGLAAAMRGFCTELGKKQKVEIDFNHAGIPPAVPQEISLCFFRVMQEALNNAVKHSGVQHFEVKVQGSPTEIHLTVRDAGVGFDPELARSSRGLGLISMRERVNMVKGTLSITSRPQSGTEISVHVPLSAETRAEEAKVAGA